MKVGIPRETAPGETRVALVPAMVGALEKSGFEVLVESGAGAGSHFSDDEYKNAGAEIADSAKKLFADADIVAKVQPMSDNETALVGEGKTCVGFMSPLSNAKTVDALLAKKATSFSMEFVPRITRAQSMDALSSMATVAGYKAVLLAAAEFNKFFPLLMTAAGTIPPATVLILGAGVAGLQAIATAKRLGAKVEAFDPRIAVKEQVMSLGAQFVEMEMPEDAETEGGYAKELADEFLRKEQEAIAARLPKVDIVVTTAQIFGKKAPILITKEMVGMMKPGSIIMDLAAEQGGNCDFTEAEKVVEENGVRIHGLVNLPALLPVHASQMYSKNITNLLNHLYQAEDKQLDFEDEITKGACITNAGELVNAFIKERREGGQG